MFPLHFDPLFLFSDVFIPEVHVLRAFVHHLEELSCFVSSYKVQYFHAHVVLLLKLLIRPLVVFVLGVLNCLHLLLHKVLVQGDPLFGQDVVKNC